MRKRYKVDEDLVLPALMFSTMIWALSWWIISITQWPNPLYGIPAGLTLALFAATLEKDNSLWVGKRVRVRDEHKDDVNEYSYKYKKVKKHSKPSLFGDLGGSGALSSGYYGSASGHYLQARYEQEQREHRQALMLAELQAQGQAPNGKPYYEREVVGKKLKIDWVKRLSDRRVVNDDGREIIIEGYDESWDKDYFYIVEGGKRKGGGKGMPRIFKIVIYGAITVFVYKLLTGLIGPVVQFLAGKLI